MNRPARVPPLDDAIFRAVLAAIGRAAAGRPTA
jgi:hypothetical protein